MWTLRQVLTTSPSVKIEDDELKAETRPAKRQRCVSKETQEISRSSIKTEAHSNDVNIFGELSQLHSQYDELRAMVKAQNEQIKTLMNALQTNSQSTSVPKKESDIRSMKSDSEDLTQALGDDLYDATPEPLTPKKNAQSVDLNYMGDRLQKIENKHSAQSSTGTASSKSASASPSSSDSSQRVQMSHCEDADLRSDTAGPEDNTDQDRESNHPSRHSSTSSSHHNSTKDASNDFPVNTTGDRLSRLENDLETTSPCESSEDSSLDEHSNVKTVKQTITLYDGMRMPAAIEAISPFKNCPGQAPEEFSFKLLHKLLGGTLMGTGWWLTAAGSGTTGKRPKKLNADRLFPDLRAYLLLNGDHEPLLPRWPGQHGAQVSGFIQYRDEFPFPLFIRRGQGGYKYYGIYKEPCYSDRIGCNEMAREVPDHVKEYWAQTLGARPKNGKNRKHLTAIKDAWPKKPVGWWDEATKSMINYISDLEEEYGEPLKRPITDKEAEAITTQDIMTAFTKADFDEDPSMRLFYEYLQCIDYDYDFYNKLVAKKRELRL